MLQYHMLQLARKCCNNIAIMYDLIFYDTVR